MIGKQLLKSGRSWLAAAGSAPSILPLSLRVAWMEKLNFQPKLPASFPHLSSAFPQTPRPKQRKQEVERVGPAFQIYLSPEQHHQAGCQIGFAAWALGTLLRFHSPNEEPLGGLGGNLSHLRCLF